MGIIKEELGCFVVLFEGLVRQLLGYLCMVRCLVKKDYVSRE